MQIVVEQDNRERLAALWTVCEQLLHTPHYKATYSSWLSEALQTHGDKAQTIFDTAAGVGFPAKQLYEADFKNLWCSDADPDLLRQLMALIGCQKNEVAVLCVDWQSLPQTVMNQFDTVLCLDASIGFMDSWSAGAMVSGPDTVLARVREVLRNFYDVTKPGGHFYVGLQKNNNRSNTERYVMEVGTAELDGSKATATWDMRYDWPTRRKTWVNKVEYRGDIYEQTRHSYLFDKSELMRMLVEIGFEDSWELATPEFFYEDIMVARKPNGA